MAKKVARSSKYVYPFGGGKADGDGSMRNLLGGKGANLAEMAGHPSLKLPVPAGFTITTEVCTYYHEHRRKYPSELKGQLERALRTVERIMGRKFGDPKNPLLVSVRSGARSSMPGMMETVLNCGLTTKTIPGLIRQAGGDERFVYDAYRRLITMYSDVVMEKAAGLEPGEGQGIRVQLDRILQDRKRQKGVEDDTDLDVNDLKEICRLFRERVKEVLGKAFPDNADKQLWGGIGAVFASWNGKRAVAYRRIEGIPGEWGTAVNVQAMVFGNLGTDSATGVAFTRDPGNGAKVFYGEYLVNAQGEDVVAGIRTPAPINEDSASEHNRDMTTLQRWNPRVYRELDAIQKRLERHYRDMQDIEFTVEKGRLFMLQCRVGKRNGPAAVKMAVDMVKERLIDRELAVQRVSANQLDELLHPILDPSREAVTQPFARGLPAGPGGATGQIVFTAEEAIGEVQQGRQVVLVREETNPEDVEGMRAANAILTARGGMTSHAALVARGWGKCCVVGCGALDIDVDAGTLRVGSQTLHRGDWISLNGTKGCVYEDRLPMIDVSEDNPVLAEFLKICDSVRKLKVRTNADTPEDARRARAFGAEGIGLFRTEHMFYGEHSDEPLFKLRKMIVSTDESERRAALDELYPYIKRDIKATLEEMEGYPVTIRLLDPPLHEFIPHAESGKLELASAVGISVEALEKRSETLHEVNPMMGHRGVRLGVTYPEITETQVRAILEAAAELLKEGRKVFPEIMIPVVCNASEFEDQYRIVRRVYGEVLAANGLKKIPHMTGTMIEIPRAALCAGEIARVAEFFSFGTNDLTQMSFGFSRDDVAGFMGDYLERKLLPADPFETLDECGVGELVKIGIERGRSTRPGLKVGICGEHGGEAASVKFCHRSNMDYVSCSPYRVPIARLAAAQAAAEERLAAAVAGNGNGRRRLSARAASGSTGARAGKAAKKKSARGRKSSKKRASAAKARGTKKRSAKKKPIKKKSAKKSAKRSAKKRATKKKPIKKKSAKKRAAKRSSRGVKKAAARRRRPRG